MNGPVRTRLPGVLLLLLATLPMAGCAVAGGIFKAGFWTAVIVIVVIIAIIAMVARR